MGKLEYLDALKRAMTGLAPEVQARTLAYYEQRFIDGLATGRSEADISKDLDDPKKIAMTLRASSHLSAFEQKRHPFNLVRLVVSTLGLAIFNLFMVVPAAVYASLLAAMYACALGFYVAGIAITASGLSGANELVLAGPLRHFITSDDDAGAPDTQTKITIGDTGVHVFQEKVPEPPPSATAHAYDEDAEVDATPPVIKRAEAVAGRGIRISTDMDAGSRTTQTFFGLTMVVGAIILFLLSLVVTKYTVIGVKRYIEMNFSLLKGN
jgi:uncharacterized membrane protein